MIDVKFIESQIWNWAKPFLLGSYVIVPTTLTYPSGSAVMVYVEGGNNEFMLSDGGGAVAHLHEMGAYDVNGIAFLKGWLIGSEWCVNESGWIRSRRTVKKEEFLSKVFELAEISDSLSKSLLKKVKSSHFSEFKYQLESDLDRLFYKQVVKKKKLLGATNKEHTFDFVAQKSDLMIVIDGVNPESSDINKTIISHVDIKNVGVRNRYQMIIYDEKENWRSADIALLGLAFPPIPYSKAKIELQSLAAA